LLIYNTFLLYLIKIATAYDVIKDKNSYYRRGALEKDPRWKRAQPLNIMFLASNSKKHRIRLVIIFILQDLLNQNKMDLNGNA